MTANPDDSNQNGYVEKNYEFVRPVPAFILGFVLLFASEIFLFDRKASMMRSDYRGEVTTGICLYLLLAFFYSIYFFLKEARKRHQYSKLPLFSYFCIFLAMAIFGLHASISNFYFFEGVYETAKSRAGIGLFHPPTAMLPLLLARMFVHLFHKPSQRKTPVS